METHNLRSRDDLLANGLSRLDTCNICFDGFDSTHIPTRFTDKNSCPHIFGEVCLRKWLLSDNENANKCPTCRHVLFRHDNRRESHDSDQDEEEDEELEVIQLEDIDRDIAELFIKNLAEGVKEVDYRTDDALRMFCDSALQECDPNVYFEIKTTVWYRLRRVVRHMRDAVRPKHWTYWLLTMYDVVGWQFDMVDLFGDENSEYDDEDGIEDG